MISSWKYLKFFIITTITILLRSSTFVKAETRCYDNLGCYDSGILHALPQDPYFVRTSFTGSCIGHIDDVIIQAVDNETEWRILIDNSSLDTSLETVFIIHGFTDSGEAPWVARMRDAFLMKGTYNVFAVDWSHAAKFPYQQAVANTYLVARQLAVFLEYLERVHGLSPIRVHLVGHSLGSQIAGNAGNDLKNSRVARISGLDPAEPYFGYQNDSMRLDATDALFVDVIHTDGERFSGFHGYGSLRAQGHVDFYPNGGTKQPGCNDPNAPFGILADKRVSYVVEIKTSDDQHHSYGQLIVSLNGTKTMTNQTELNRANHHYHENESDKHVITVTSNLGDVTSVEFEFQTGRGLSSLGTSSDLKIASVSISLLDGSQSWVSGEDNTKSDLHPSPLGVTTPKPVTTPPTKKTMTPLLVLHGGIPGRVELHKKRGHSL